jgi:hypothetical protein
VIGRPLLAGIPAYLAGAALVQWRPPQHWPLFLFEASLSATLGLSSAIALGTTVEDREVFRERLVGIVPEEWVKAR